MSRRPCRLALALLAAVASQGCDGGAEPAPKAPPATAGKALPVFEECAEASGISYRMEFIPNEQGEQFRINVYDHGCGVAVGDFDGDGHDDIYFLNQFGANALYRNEGAGKFKDVTVAMDADLALADRICVAATFGDYDGDGRQDLFVTTTRGGNVLFHNEGGGKFKDVTAKTGVALVAHCQTGTFFDGDSDGDLDLYVTCTAKWTTDEFDPETRHFMGPVNIFDNAERPIEHNVYFRNEGNGKFTDATGESGLAAYGWCCECAVFDADGDGRIDLFVSSMFGKSVLFRNVGGGKFVDVTETALGRVPYGAVGTRAFDANVDGRLDLMVADMHADMWAEPDLDVKLVSERRKYDTPYGTQLERGKITETEAKRLLESIAAIGRRPIFGNVLYVREGGGGFVERSDPAGVETFQPWGVVPADFRNCGAEDVFVPSGMGYPYFFWRNNYLLNNADGTFTECGAAAGFDPPPGGRVLEAKVGGKPAVRSSRSAATADFDEDGRVDLVVNEFADHAHLYMNRSPVRNWVEFRFTGTNSNRDAIGTLVTLRAGGKTLVRQVQAAGGYLSQSTKAVHFGLGDATSVEGVDIVWPSGTRQHLDHPEAGRRHDVNEPEK